MITVGSYSVEFSKERKYEAFNQSCKVKLLDWVIYWNPLIKAEELEVPEASLLSIWESSLARSRVVLSSGVCLVAKRSWVRRQWVAHVGRYWIICTSISRIILTPKLSARLRCLSYHSDFLEAIWWVLDSGLGVFTASRAWKREGIRESISGCDVPLSCATWRQSTAQCPSWWHPGHGPFPCRS